MLSRVICLGTLVIIMGTWAVSPVKSASIPIYNASFEGPAVDPNFFPAVPFVDDWMEIDLDTLGSTNTGVFANTPAVSPDHVVNAHGNQLVFLGSQAGNALEQDLIDTYRVGCDYRLTVAVGVSSLFSPSIAEPVDTLKLVLYYSDANEPADILHQTVDATALSSTLLTDVSLYIPAVQTGDAWAGKTIGVALRAAGAPGGFWVLDHVRLTESLPVSIAIDNASFEAPVLDPNGFPAVPFVDQWIEIDVDTLASANTGVFANTAAESWDHINNADGQQLVFLGSEQGNAMEQDLTATYGVGCDYRLTVAVGISSRFAPSSEVPVDILELVLFYRDGADVVDIVSQPVDATGLSPHSTTDVSLHLPTVQSGDAWADMTISVALRSIGMPGGFWVLDHVRLAQSLPDPDSALTVME